MRVRVKRGRKTISVNALKSESVKGSPELRARFRERLEDAKRKRVERTKKEKNADSEYLETLRKDFKDILENLRY